MHQTSQRTMLCGPRSSRHRFVGVALVGAVTAVAGLGFSAPAQASGNSVWDRVAFCESSGNWSINTGNTFYGGLQFTLSTWRAFGGATYAARADLATKTEQIWTAQKTLRVQGPHAWPVCSVKANLTLANGLAPYPGTSRDAPRVVKLVVDGDFGTLTTKAVQRWAGTTQDGILGPISKRALQKKVGVVQDGVIGAKTIRALQAKIGAPLDGRSTMSATTVRALQTYLNANVLV